MDNIGVLVRGYNILPGSTRGVTCWCVVFPGVYLRQHLGEQHVITHSNTMMT